MPDNVLTVVFAWQWVCVLTSDFTKLPAVHAKVSSTIFLSNEDDRGSPGTGTFLYNVILQHLSNLLSCQLLFMEPQVVSQLFNQSVVCHVDVMLNKICSANLSCLVKNTSSLSAISLVRSQLPVWLTSASAPSTRLSSSSDLR